MNTRILLGLTLSFAIAAGAEAAPPVFSDAPPSDSGARQVAVRYADLDLTRADGASVLLSRLRRAASLACGGRPSSPVDLGAMQDYRACVRNGLDGAVGRVNAPLVTAFYHQSDRALASAGGPG
ncbi:MAG TPA: UrcA family protein [Caulobacteraceae bacterium]|nr:UrcA family protein [Caulobacteraceae bacterium]